MPAAAKISDAGASATPELVITRVFQAPQALVWRAWTDPESLAQWWGPKGSKVRVVKLEVRPGGVFHYAMQYRPGHEIWGRFIYREIAAPERLVYVSSFSDPDGGVTRAPFAQIPTWPLEILNSVTLSEAAGRTTLTLHGTPINATAEEVAAFARMHDSMRQGFGGSFDQLDQYLATTD